MANYANLLATIAANIYTNGNQEVTAAMVKSAVDAMVGSLGYGYQFRGAAAPSDNPGTPDQRVYYVAKSSGTYTNFGGFSVSEDEVAILKWDSAWSKEVVTINAISTIAPRLAQQDIEIASFEQAVRELVENYPNVTIYGNVTNNPDNEDINTNDNNQLQFADRSTLYGMGYKILRRDKTFAEQVTQANTIYEIRYNFVLAADFTIPNNCILRFNGGSISGAYALSGNMTVIETAPNQIFGNDITFGGTWNIKCAFSEWFGAKGDGNTDCAPAINKLISQTAINRKIKFGVGHYRINSPIIVYNSRNITFEGVINENFPWVSASHILAGADIPYIFQLVADYNYGTIPSIYARSISINNLLIDGNGKATIGINLCAGDIEKCAVRNCKEDGIIFEACTYPVRLENCLVNNNGGNGLYIKAPFTTVYSIKNSEFNYNNGYGILIEDGNTATLSNVAIQSNKRGGLYILRKRSEDFDHEIFLSRITFINLYTEANGSLSADDVNFDGNYTIKIESLLNNADNVSTFEGKIDGLTFLNSTIYPNNYLIKGTSNTLILNTNIELDDSKNIPPYLGKIRLGTLRIGGGDTISTFINKSNIPNVASIKKSDNSADFTGVNTTSYSYIGLFTQYDGYITMANAAGISPADTYRVYLSFERYPKIRYTSGENCIVGDGYYGTEKVTFIWNVGFLNKGFIIMRADGTYLQAKDIVNDKKLTFHISFTA